MGLKAIILSFVLMFQISDFALAKQDLKVDGTATVGALIEALATSPSTEYFLNMGWQESFGILACYKSDSEGEFCMINPIGSSIFDKDMIESGFRLRDPKVFEVIIEQGDYFDALKSGLMAKFIKINCYDPIGTNNIADEKHCLLSSNHEEAN